ncbi:MAG: M20 family metallopeptidase [Candidatus Thorarchaeota archaeon]
MTDQKRLLTLAQQLVSIPSENPPGHEIEVAKALRSHLENYGISCMSIGPRSSPNLLFSTLEGQMGPLAIHGHMDTVPIGPRDAWTQDPLGGEVINGRLYGRGAADMKGPLASLAETMIRYKEENHRTPLLMLATSGEEKGYTGAEDVAKSGVLKGVKYGVCAEPTSLNVFIGEKGILWTRLVTHGKAAHGSRPGEGLNAIDICIEALEILTGLEYDSESDFLLGTQVINTGYIEGGARVNVVPDRCEARIDMRIVKGQTPEGILSSMNKRLNTSGLSNKASVEIIHGNSAVITPFDSEIVSSAIEAVTKATGQAPEPMAAPFGTDCSVLQPRIGFLNVICGPGSIEQAHQVDEFIDVDQLYQSVDVYLRIARHFSKE